MQIMVLLLVLGIAVLGTLLATLAASLVLGTAAAFFPRTRIIAPLLLLIVPCAAVGAIAGGFAIGWIVVQRNESGIVLGPLLGILIGAIAGAIVGLVGAGAWWYRGFRKRDAQGGHLLL